MKITHVHDNMLIFGLKLLNEDKVMFTIYPEKYHWVTIADRFKMDYKDLYQLLIENYNGMINQYNCLFFDNDEDAEKALLLVDSFLIAEKLKK